MIYENLSFDKTENRRGTGKYKHQMSKPSQEKLQLIYAHGVSDAGAPTLWFWIPMWSDFASGNEDAEMQWDILKSNSWVKNNWVCCRKCIDCCLKPGRFRDTFSY